MSSRSSQSAQPAIPRVLNAQIEALAQDHPLIAEASRDWKDKRERHGRSSSEARHAFAHLAKLAEITSRCETPAALIVELKSSNDPRHSEPARRQLHGELLAGAVYKQLVDPSLDATWGSDDALAQETRATTVQYAADVLDRLQPQGPFEEMLAMQALWLHARIARLNILLARQGDPQLLRMLSEAVDRATNTYRKLMLTFSEIRRPPRGDSFTAIQQANFAQQQVVQNIDQENRKSATNEQGLS